MATPKVDHESGTQWFLRSIARPPVSLFPEILGSFVPDGTKPIIELQGESSSGKTLFLTHYVARCILPETYKHFQIGGLNVGVMVIDCDMDFSLATLSLILQSLVESAVPRSERKSLRTSDLESIVLNSLQRLKLKRCSNSKEFVASIGKLKNALVVAPDVSVVIVDSLSAFYWTMTSSEVQPHYAMLMKFMCEALKDAKIPGIVTANALFDRKRDPRGCNWQNFLGLGIGEHVRRRIWFQLETDKENNEPMSLFQTFSSDDSVAPCKWKMDLRSVKIQ
jgi:hypothetical protein